MDSIEVSYRSSDGLPITVSPSNLDAATVAAGQPWRTFPWYLGQRHYSGVYWAATNQDLVGYESRLERAHLMALDFDVSVRRISSQPFHIVVRDGGPPFRRTPDFLCLTERGPLVIDVKPQRELDKPKTRQALDRTHRIIESWGWEYRVCAEPDPTIHNNVRFLAGYRRGWLFDQELLRELRSLTSASESFRIHDLVMGVNHPAPKALAAVLHLLWRQELRADLTRPLSKMTALVVAS